MAPPPLAHPHPKSAVLAAYASGLTSTGRAVCGQGSSPMPLPSSTQVVHRVGALLQRLVPKPVQDLRDLLGEGRLQLPPPLPAHQVVQQHLQHGGDMLRG